MNQMNRAIPPHLTPHYKLLDLPVGAPFDQVQKRYRQLYVRLKKTKARHNGEAAHKFLPKLERAFLALKRTLLDPESARHAPAHPLQTVLNASVPDSPYRLPEQTTTDPHASGNQPSGVLSSKLNSSQIPPLHPVPKYQPQNQFMQPPRNRMAPGFSIISRQNNIFDAAEDRAVLVHAVNCQGVWGMGIALQIKKALPEAFKVYTERCKAAGSALIGQCLLIPPQPADYQVKGGTKFVHSHRHWVACLFTSTGYGKKNSARNNPGKDSVAEIRVNTKKALGDLRMQLEAFGPSSFDIDASWNHDDENPGKILAVKFNSGAFGVPWEATEAIIHEVFSGSEQPWYVFEGGVPSSSKQSKLEKEMSERRVAPEVEGN